MHNPYITNSIVLDEHFYGRKEIIEELLYTEKVCIYLAGLRRSGKSSLLKRIEQQARSSIPLFCSLQGIDENEMDAGLEQVFLDNITENPHPELNFVKAYRRTGHICSLIGYLSRSQYPLLILWDECENLTCLPDGELEQLHTLLVGEKNKRGMIRTILTASMYLKKEMEKREWKTSPFLEGMDLIYLPPFNDTEAKELIEQTQSKEGKVNVPEKLARKIMDACGNQPYLIQHMCYELYNASDRSLIDNKSKLKQITDNVSDFNAAFLNDFNALHDDQKQLLRILGNSTRTTKITENAKLILMNDLQKMGVVRQYKDSWSITNEYFEVWIKINQAEPRETITWLHLSDFHFRASQSYKSNIVLNGLLEDIPRMRKEGISPDFIILSGDIAFSGKKEEYALAQEFLDKLLEVTQLSKERLFLVPGNHDVNREDILTTVSLSARLLTDREIIHKILSNPRERSLYLERQQNYCDFIKSYFGSLRQPELSLIEKIKVKDWEIGIIGLNSAWLSASEDDRHHLVVGEYQVRQALSEINNCRLRLAVMHHPLDWLQDFDRDGIEPLLQQECHFILHGHMHQTSIRQENTPDSDARVFVAGACYEGREFPNSYNYVSLDGSAGTGTIYLRMYTDKRGGFWTKDVVNYRNVEGSYRFPLPDTL